MGLFKAPAHCTVCPVTGIFPRHVFGLLKLLPGMCLGYLCYYLGCVRVIEVITWDVLGLLRVPGMCWGYWGYYLGCVGVIEVITWDVFRLLRLLSGMIWSYWGYYLGCIGVILLLLFSLECFGVIEVIT